MKAVLAWLTQTSMEANWEMLVWGVFMWLLGFSQFIVQFIRNRKRSWLSTDEVTELINDTSMKLWNAGACFALEKVQDAYRTADPSFRSSTTTMENLGKVLEGYKALFKMEAKA